MNRKTIFQLFSLFSALRLFAQDVSVDLQNSAQDTTIVKIEATVSYLDSIKKTFIKDRFATNIDSLWHKELIGLDLYNYLSEDIQTKILDDNQNTELSTALLKERLAILNAKSPFNIEYNVGLESIIKSFLKNRKPAFGRLMALSEYYFPIFEEALAAKNIPLEIKYLAIVESALNPKAVSKMGATGLWQFMYQTAKQYNLNIDSYVDERCDPLKASAAAAAYMEKMYAIFRDWDLVLASYNSGPGNVTKAIRRSGGQQNFWNIKKYLPKETQGYLPAFLATMYIYEFHKEHGIVADRAIVRHFDTDTIMIKKQISFKQISDLFDIPVTQLQLLNPSYKMNVIPNYSNRVHTLRLPKNIAAIFASNEDRVYAYVQHEIDAREKPFEQQKAVAVVKKASINQEIVQGSILHRVQRGENLNQIATKYNVAVLDIKKWNKLRSNLLSSGKSLKIYKSIEIADQQVAEAKTELTTSPQTTEDVNKQNVPAKESLNNIKYHLVQKGDNLNSIAKKYNLKIEDLKKRNNLSSATVVLGTSIIINPLENTEDRNLVSNNNLENVEYVVKKGDFLGSIAKKFGSTIADLKSWNNIDDNNVLLGQRIIVAKKVLENITEKSQTTAHSPNTNTINYLVKQGDSLYSISRKFSGVSVSDIKKWNNITGEDIKPGMKLRING